MESEVDVERIVGDLVEGRLEVELLCWTSSRRAGQKERVAGIPRGWKRMEGMRTYGCSP